ncbi:MAG: hypothetical protein ACTHOH_14650 [Lysobacteraceae bacterium]
MPHPDNPFGSFKSDDHRLEAVRLREDRLRLRERRLLWLGLSACIAVVVVCLFTDHPAVAATSLATLVRIFSR